MTEHPRILMVEDSATQAVRMSHLLEQQGWEVVCATTAENALEEINRQIPDLILADYELPNMQGDEFCQRVRMNLNTRAIPIMMLTAREGQQAEAHGLESGADDYAAKSLEDEILVLRIQALLRKTRAHRAIISPGETYFRRARVLVIDDSLTYRTAISQTLAEEGFTVEVAADGDEGLKRVRENGFDCVIVDLVMPKMDGIQVCRELTALRQAMDSPIVVLMLTAHETKEDMTRGLEAGADDFVGKSSDNVVLKARIRALLRRKFFQEENQRIIEELKNKELEAVRARAEKEVSEARAALVEQLEEANAELEQANRKLKDAQTQLVHSEKMASLGQLVAGIAHELNNPLSFVTNNLFLIGEGVEKVIKPVESDLPQATLKRLEKLRAQLEDTATGLDRVGDLVQKLRSFSRLDAGVFGVLDLAESIDMVLKFLHHKTKDRVEVKTELGHEAPLHCYAGELNQVLMNVIANAVDAIEGAGTVTIRTQEKDGDMLIRVRDTGCGIPDAIKDRIFEPFFTTKPVGSGMGLGLSLAYSVVQAHEGDIEVESGPGKGSEFVIRIPLDLKHRLKHA